MLLLDKNLNCQAQPQPQLTPTPIWAKFSIIPEFIQPPDPTAGIVNFKPMKSSVELISVPVVVLHPYGPYPLWRGPYPFWCLTNLPEDIKITPQNSELYCLRYYSPQCAVQMVPCP